MKAESGSGAPMLTAGSRAALHQFPRAQAFRYPVILWPPSPFQAYWPSSWVIVQVTAVLRCLWQSTHDFMFICCSSSTLACCFTAP